jgi:hypothetical protein
MTPHQHPRAHSNTFWFDVARNRARMIAATLPRYDVDLDPSEWRDVTPPAYVIDEVTK